MEAGAEHGASVQLFNFLGMKMSESGFFLWKNLCIQAEKGAAILFLYCLSLFGSDFSVGEGVSARGRRIYFFRLKSLNSKNRSCVSNDQVMNLMWPNIAEGIIMLD